MWCKKRPAGCVNVAFERETLWEQNFRAQVLGGLPARPVGPVRLVRRSAVAKLSSGHFRQFAPAKSFENFENFQISEWPNLAKLASLATFPMSRM